MKFLRQEDKKIIKAIEKKNEIINKAILEQGEELNKLLEEGVLVKYENKRKTTRKSNAKFKWE